jgi:hypothetical protein
VSISGGGPADTDRDLLAVAKQRVRLLLGDTGAGALVLVYAAGPRDWLELGQWPAKGRMLPAGEPATVHGAPAVLTVDAGRDPTGFERRDVLTWIERGTYLELRTTRGQAGALRLAESLRPTTLAARTPAPAEAPPRQP